MRKRLLALLIMVLFLGCSSLPAEPESAPAKDLYLLFGPTATLDYSAAIIYQGNRYLGYGWEECEPLPEDAEPLGWTLGVPKELLQYEVGLYVTEEGISTSGVGAPTVWAIPVEKCVEFTSNIDAGYPVYKDGDELFAYSPGEDYCIYRNGEVSYLREPDLRLRLRKRD